VGRRLGDLLAKIASGGSAQASLLQRTVEVDYAVGLFGIELRGAVFEIERDIAEVFFLLSWLPPCSPNGPTAFAIAGSFA
jgi:hypothetical protein